MNYLTGVAPPSRKSLFAIFGWRLATVVFFAMHASPVHARLELSRASVERLDNGLTLIMLEDRTFPVVSVQMTYKTGAKDDPAGRLGLAHFFEHMAFRGSKNFPDTGLVSEIYAVGGEWHGYTWIDSTNYFATVPKEHLPLLLDIEADRMARLDVRKEDVEAERGAVLAEMNGYANEPGSILFDALMATHFLTHSYRNNTIGYSADISAITHDDLVAFYNRHYAPGNAILAVVGDFDRKAVREQVAKQFQKIRKPIVGRDPLTPEIPRTGERRIRLSLPAEKKLFKIAWPAPAASSDDFAPFLVLQALIGDSAGVNFNQNDWGTPVGDDSPIAGAAKDVSTWIIPTAEPYAFVVSGSSTPAADEAKIEHAIQSAFDMIARGELNVSALSRAKEKVATALAFDVDTTEEAAHQFAYFASIGAFDRLMSLEKDVAAVTPGQVKAAAARYLAADQRTIAWLEPGAAVEQLAAHSPTASPKERAGSPSLPAPIAAPIAFKSGAGVSVLVQPSNLSPTIAVKALVAGTLDCDSCAPDAIAFGMTAVSAVRPAGELDAALRAVSQAVKTAERRAPGPFSDNPIARLEETFASLAPRGATPHGAMLLSVSGDVDPDSVAEAVEEYFSNPETVVAVTDGPAAPLNDIDILIDDAKAQAAVGYIAAAPGAPRAVATRLALYVLSHGYEGRLGKEAISRRGLAYYIDAQYRGDGKSGFVTLAAGVDPDKLEAFRTVLKSELERLVSEPPTDAEIAEAKRHLFGRKISAAQSNEELAEALIRDALAMVAPESAADFQKRLDAVTGDDVRKAAGALAEGAIVTVRVGGVE